MPGSDLIAINPSPQRFRQVRIGLIAEGVLLVALGIGGVVAASAYHGANPTGATVMMFRFTMLHALVILGTGVLAILAATKRPWGLRFTIAQAIGYFLVFIISGGHNNSFSDPADSILHALDGDRWVHRPRGEQRRETA